MSLKTLFSFIIFLTLLIKLIIMSIVFLINCSFFLINCLFFDVINLLLILIRFIMIKSINKAIVKQNNKINDNREIYYVKKMNR